MTKVHTTLISNTLCSVLLPLGVAWTAAAQEQMSVSAQASSTTAVELRTSTGDCDDADDRCEPSVRDAGDCDDADGRCEPGAQSAQVDPSTPITNANTNVCNDIRCPDGSCATNAQLCSSTDIDAFNRPVTPDNLDADSDDDGLSDGTNPRQDEYSPIPSRTGAVTSPDFNDPDDDDDGLPTSSGSVDKASPKLFDTLRNKLDQDGPNDTTGRTTGFIKFDDIRGEVRASTETEQQRLSRIAITASDLRNWTVEDRAAFTRLREEVSSNTPEAASLHIAALVLADDKIEELDASENVARITYRANVQLFGLIPIEREVEARTQADGSVEIDYPWYRFLSSTPDTEAIEGALKQTIEILMTVTADPI